MKLTYVVQETQKLKTYLRSLSLPNHLMCQVLAQKLLSVNGVRNEFVDVVSQGDCVEIELPKESASSNIAKEDLPLTIVYEDEYLLIIDKAPFMPVMITKSHPCGTLMNALAFYYEKYHIECSIHLINRLDKETMGLILVAKNSYVKSLMTVELKSKISREYYAIVSGILDQKSGVITSPIGQPDSMSMKRAVIPTGKNAITEYHVLQEFSGMSLLAITLKTGRTHQIRVHMASMGHPLIGDPLYSNNALVGDYLMLQSHRVSFAHPITSQSIEINLELSNIMKNYIQSSEHPHKM